MTDEEAEDLIFKFVHRYTGLSREAWDEYVVVAQSGSEEWPAMFKDEESYQKFIKGEWKDVPEAQS